MDTAAITTGSVFLILLSVWLAHRLALSRDSTKSRTESVAALSNAFSRAVSALSAGEVDAFHVLSSDKQQHDTAIAARRAVVRPSHVAAYDDAAERFRQLRAAVQPGIIAFTERQATRHAGGKVSNDALIAAIERILFVAKG